MPNRLFLIALLIVSFTAAAHACLWDYDTLRDERRGLPGILEILSGRFERHSVFFYERRAEAMKAKLAASPGGPDAAADWDNLAVAQEKLGRFDDALATLDEKDKHFPDQYTTHANRGTVLIHAGRLPEGIAEIEQALKINPDAHFGREKYQLLVAQYLLKAKTDPSVFDAGSFVRPLLFDDRPKTPTSRPATVSATAPTTQAAAAPSNDRSDVEDWRSHTDQQLHYARVDHPDAIEPAIKGVVGMIRFGTGTSPYLYEALGDLLAARGDKALAHRAYHRALSLDHPRAKLLRESTKEICGGIHAEVEVSDETLARERAEADQWVADYQAYEDALLRAGKDTNNEASYADFYATHPRVDPLQFVNAGSGINRGEPSRGWAMIIAVSAVVLLALGLEVFRNVRRRRAKNFSRS